MNVALSGHDCSPSAHWEKKWFQKHFSALGVGAEPILFQSFPYCAEADANAIITVLSVRVAAAVGFLQSRVHLAQ